MVRHFVYTEQGSIRQLMCVDAGSIELVRRGAARINQQVSELAANEAGENIQMTFLTPQALDMQAKLNILEECAKWFPMLKQSDRIHLPAKSK